jgi:putative sigma-54 modulation protein
MQITIKAKDLELTEPLKVYINEKIGMLEKFVQRVEEQGEILANVEVARTTKHHHKGDVFYAEVNLQLPGRRIRVQEQEYDVRVAIDNVANRLQREIEEYKEKKGLTGKAMRHMARLGKGAAHTAGKIMWWRNK